MQRTIRITVQPTAEQAHALLETHRRFTEVVNAVATYGWLARVKNGVTLHHTLYYPSKPNLPIWSVTCIFKPAAKPPRRLRVPCS